VVDVNDRALRQIVIGLGGSADGVPRQDGFDIVAASEVMAILCLADSLADLKERLGRIVVGYRADSSPVLARELKAHGAMAALLNGAGAQSGGRPSRTIRPSSTAVRSPTLRTAATR